MVNLAMFAPGVFTTNQAGTGQGAILISGSGGLVAAPTSMFPGSRPVVPGMEFISIFCTGLGPVTNQPATGAAASGSPLSTTTVPTVTIGGEAANVTFSGLAPGFVGLYQVNAQVPATAPAGDSIQLVVEIGGETASTVTLAVGPTAPTEGDGPSRVPAVSADGRFVAFHSEAGNLVANDNNGVADTFLHDTCFGAVGCTPSTIRVSVADDGSEGNAFVFSLLTSISADGRFVAFATLATNLIPGGTPGVYVRDTCIGASVGCTPTTIRVSEDDAGNPGGGDSPSISADGRFVAFQSASILAPNDGDSGISGFDMYLRDTCFGAAGCTPSTTLISVATNGTSSGNSNSSAGPVSPDGRFVAFASFADNLIPSDGNSQTDAFLRDTCFGAVGCTPSTIVISVDESGLQHSNSFNGPGVIQNRNFSDDNRFILFTSSAPLVSPDINATTDAFIRDTCLGAAGCTPSTIRVSVDSNGNGASNTTSSAAISADGRYVAFASIAPNLVTGDTNGQGDMFLRDTCFGAAGCTPSTIRVSVASDGSQGNNTSGSAPPAISADARFVVFESFASNLVPDDNNATGDIFVRDTCIGAVSCTPTTFRVSLPQ